MTKAYYVIFLFVFNSCAFIASKNENVIEYATVKNSENENTKVIALISKENKSSSFGPNFKTDSTYDNIENTSPKVSGIFFGASLYNAVSYVDVLKIFEERKIPIHIYSGVGMGAIVASLGAVGLTPELVEWKLYKLFSILKEEKIYGTKWLVIINNFITKEFSNKNIQDTQKTLILPLYDLKERRVVFVSRGPLVNILSTQFQIESPYKMKGMLSSLISQIHKKDLFIKFGTQKLFNVNIASDEISLKSSNDFIFGVYAKKIGSIKFNKNNKFIFNVLLPSKKIQLDSLQSIQESKIYLRNTINEMYNFYFKEVEQSFDDIGQNDE